MTGEDGADAADGTEAARRRASPSDGGSPTDVAPAEWRTALAEAGELTGPIVEAILAVHGDRGATAVEAVAEGRVKQYRDFTVVVGHEDEYLVEDGGCTCADATYNLDPDDPDEQCWHALAVDVARRVGAVDHHDMWYSEVREFI